MVGGREDGGSNFDVVSAQSERLPRGQSTGSVGYERRTRLHLSWAVCLARWCPSVAL